MTVIGEIKDEEIDRLQTQIDRLTMSRSMEEAAFALRSKALVEKLRDALRLADVSINPPDRGGISMEAWNKRLQSATLEIRDAIGRAENYLTSHGQ